MIARGLPGADVTRWSLLLLATLGVELLARLHVVNATFVAQPLDVVAAVAGLLPQPLVGALVTTLLEAAVSILIAGGLGVLLGYLLWRYEVIGRAYEGPLGALFASPTILLYPLALVLFGRTSLAIVAMAATFSIVPIALTSRAGLAGVSPTLINAGRVMGLGTMRIFRYILLPAAAPGIFSGLRLGLGYMLKGILAMEFLVNIGGLGTLVAESYDLFQTPNMYASILAVLLVSVLFVQALDRAERRLRRAR